LGGSCIGRYNELSETNEIKKYSYSQEVRSNVIYEFKKINLTAAIFYKYTGRLPGFMMDDNNITQTFIHDYHTADVSISKLLLKKRINLSIGSKNIFNVKNISGVSTGGAHSVAANSVAIGMGRTYFMKCDITLNSRK
jgi:outer membrane receptor for ferrienterochelin and colicins